MIDAHQHFWRLGRGDYDWPNQTVAPIFRDFEPDELAPLLTNCGITRTVLVQATPTVAETDCLLEIASRTPFVAAVVGWVDLTAPDAVDQIDRLATNPALKGLRPMLQSIQHTDWILHPAANCALRHMARLGLRFDALIQPRHLETIATLARRHPDLSIVIDHIAKPRMGAGIAPDAGWTRGMTTLAALPNVWCKLSGMVTEIGTDWTPADLSDHARQAFDGFGPARVMWGSDWPVVNLASNYVDWYAQARKLVADLSAPEQAQVFGGSAQTFYGLVTP